MEGGGHAWICLCLVQPLTALLSRATANVPTCHWKSVGDKCVAAGARYPPVWALPLRLRWASEAQGAPDEKISRAKASGLDKGGNLAMEHILGFPTQLRHRCIPLSRMHLPSVRWDRARGGHARPRPTRARKGAGASARTPQREQ